MDLKLKGMRVFVTGSSRGIGLGIVKGFLKEGCIVVSNGKSADSLSESLDSLESFENSFGLVGDVTDPRQARELIKRSVELIGGIDILVCNVGNGSSVAPGQESRQDWEKMLDINFFSTTNIVEAARNELKKSKGVVLCISSICGSEVVPGAPVAYSVAKAALNAYIRGMSRPLAIEGIRINGIAPGNILFPDSVWDKKTKDNSVMVDKMLDENVPLKRFGTPDEVANLVLWLSSSLGAFVTGSVYCADGGQTRC